MLYKRTRAGGLAYLADWDGHSTHDKMDHLVCFVPGMLALGAFNAAGTPGEATAARDLEMAKALMYTCWQVRAGVPMGRGACCLQPEEPRAHTHTRRRCPTHPPWQMYARTATGLAPEYVDFPGGNDMVGTRRVMMR